jgi:hypothetical protein
LMTIGMHKHYKEDGKKRISTVLWEHYYVISRSFTLTLALITFWQRKKTRHESPPRMRAPTFQQSCQNNQNFICCWAHGNPLVRQCYICMYVVIAKPTSMPTYVVSGVIDRYRSKYTTRLKYL